MVNKNPFNFIAHLDNLLSSRKGGGSFILLVMVLWKLLSVKYRESDFDAVFVQIQNNKKDPAQLILKSMRDLEQKYPKYASGIFSQVPLRVFPELKIKTWDEVFMCLNSNVGPEIFARPEAIREFCRVLLETGLRDLNMIRLVNFELYRFMADILEIQPEERIMFAGCGAGLAAIGCLEREPESSIYAQDVAWEQVVITKILLALFGYDHSRVIQEDIFSEPAFRSGADRLAYFDSIISYPPVGFMHRNYGNRRQDKYGRFPDMLMGKMTYEMAFLAHTIRIMHPRTGRACLLFPARFLNMESCSRFRNHMISSNIIDTIISLPRYLLTGNTPDCIMLILKSNKPSRDMLFVDACHFADPKTRTIDIYGLFKACKEKEDLESSMIVPSSTALDNDGNLHPLIYKKPRQDNLTGIHELKEEVVKLENELNDVRQSLMNRLDEIALNARN